MAQNDPLHVLVAGVFDVPADQIDDESSPDTVSSWDSLGHLRLVSTVEEQLGVELDPDALLDLECVGDLRRLLEELGRPVTAGDRPAAS